MTRKGKTAVLEIEDWDGDSVYVEYAKGQLLWHLVVLRCDGPDLTASACPPEIMPEADGRKLNQMVARALGVA